MRSLIVVFRKLPLSKLAESEHHSVPKLDVPKDFDRPRVLVAVRFLSNVGFKQTYMLPHIVTAINLVCASFVIEMYLSAQAVHLADHNSSCLNL